VKNPLCGLPTAYTTTFHSQNAQDQPAMALASPDMTAYTTTLNQAMVLAQDAI
jgi:hypothetical protein